MRIRTLTMIIDEKLLHTWPNLTKFNMHCFLRIMFEHTQECENFINEKNDLLQKDAHFGDFWNDSLQNSSTFWVISDQTKIPENLAEFATSEAPTAGAHGRVATCQKGRPRRPPGRGVGKFTSKPSENSVRISLDFPWLWEVGWAWFILMMDDEVQKIWYHCLDYTCRPCYI